MVPMRAMPVSTTTAVLTMHCVPATQHQGPTRNATVATAHASAQSPERMSVHVKIPDPAAAEVDQDRLIPLRLILLPRTDAAVPARSQKDRVAQPARMDPLPVV